MADEDTADGKRLRVCCDELWALDISDDTVIICSSDLCQ
jgi:hypothetical protein